MTIKNVLIFLDFDGVLHPVCPRDDLPASESQPFCYLPRLAQVLQDFPGIEIVITSTWRLHRDLDQLREMFPVELRGKIVGATAELVADERFGGRELEALAWRDQHRPGAQWVALDDLTTAWPTTERLVLCFDGFRDAEEARMRTLLTAFAAQTYPA